MSLVSTSEMLVRGLVRAASSQSFVWQQVLTIAQMCQNREIYLKIRDFKNYFRGVC